MKHLLFCTHHPATELYNVSGQVDIVQLHAVRSSHHDNVLLWCNTITYQAASWRERDRERAVVMDTEQSGDEPLQRKSYHRQQQRCGGAVAAVVTYYARCWLGWCRHCTLYVVF